MITEPEQPDAPADIPGVEDALARRTATRIISLRAAKQAGDLVGSEPFMMPPFH